jgi:hypothetical protein
VAVSSAKDNPIKDKGLGHIEDPGMLSLMQREIAR